MSKNRSKLLVLFIIIIVLSSWGKHLVVLFDDGFTYRLASGCEVTIMGKEKEILYYGHTNVHGRVYARNLQEGDYRIVLRMFNRRYETGAAIEDLESTDTLFIPGR